MQALANLAKSHLATGKLEILSIKRMRSVVLTVLYPLLCTIRPEILLIVYCCSSMTQLRVHNHNWNFTTTSVLFLLFIHDKMYI